jgi:hypothetical protein
MESGFEQSASLWALCGRKCEWKAIVSAEREKSGILTQSTQRENAEFKRVKRGRRVPKIEVKCFL